VSTVTFCHMRNMYHHDIKPRNLLMDDVDDLKVLDFILSIITEQLWHNGWFHTFCGLPVYVAPEMLSDAHLWSSPMLVRGRLHVVYPSGGCPWCFPLPGEPGGLRWHCCCLVTVGCWHGRQLLILIIKRQPRERLAPLGVGAL
jgi:serine/threonine protein kinase